MVPGTPQAFANANKDKETFLKKKNMAWNKQKLQLQARILGKKNKKTFNLPRGYC